MFHAFFSRISEVRNVNIQVWITTLYTCFQRFLFDGRQRTSAAARRTLCLSETTSPWTLRHSPSRLILLSRKPPLHPPTSGRDPQGFNVSALCKLICASVRWCEPATQEEKKSREVTLALRTKQKHFCCCSCQRTAPPKTDHELDYDGWVLNIPFNSSWSDIVFRKYFNSLTKHKFY